MVVDLESAGRLT